MRCTTCENLSPETLSVVKPEQYATIFIDELQLVSSASSGQCLECRMLYDAISLKRTQWATERQASLSIVLNVAVGRPLQIIWNKVGIFLRISRPQSGTRAETAPSLPPVIGPAPNVSEDSGSEACLSSLSSWYDECKTSHALCNFQSTTFLPTRVVDLGEDLVPTADISLLETKGAQGEYMTLSYCWGEKRYHPRLKTTVATLNNFKSKILFSALPLTMQHAVILTRRLKCRYLWIDSLCIVQDNDEDWKKEAGKMCNIYSFSALTIVACSSDGCSGGIFGKQSYSTSSQIPYKDTFVNVSDDYTRDHQPDLLLHQSQNLDPVHTRAWTLQEAVLSHRTVFFTSQELRWECNTRRLCECGHFKKTFPATINDPEEWQYENYRIWRLDDFFPVTSPADAYQLWVYIYHSYSSRALAVDSDRLVALAGLARRFAQIMKTRFGRDEKYLAGLWKGSLPRDLLWHIEPLALSMVPGRRHERPKVWRAPSWSWASMEADSHCLFFRDLQSRMEIEDSSVEIAGPDIYGQVKPGPQNYLRLTAPVLFKVRFKFDAGEMMARKFPFIVYQDCDLRVAVLHVDDDLGQDTDDYIRMNHSQLAVLVVGFSPGGDTHEVLILKSTIGKRNTFERIGMARLGPHFREPQEHKLLIEQVPCETVILL